MTARFDADQTAIDRHAKPRHRAGIIVIIFLGIVFFAILALLVLTAGRRHGAATHPEAEKLTVLPIRIRLRTEPNAKAPVVATATSGETLNMIEDHGAWVHVATTDGLTGWAERSGLERTIEREQRLARFAAIRKLPPLDAVSNKRTTLYAGPGIFYPIIGELSADEPAKVFTRDHDFYAIDDQGSIAYADIDSIDVRATGTRQVEVRNQPATTTTGPATETTPLATESAPPQPPAAAPVVAEADQSGVYAAVPAAGTQPEEIDRVVPRYPPAARYSGVSGPVVIRGIVRKDGRIDEVQIIKDLPYGLGEAAREAVEQWRFRPATFRGEPIDVYYTVTVNFGLR